MFPTYQPQTLISLLTFLLLLQFTRALPLTQRQSTPTVFSQADIDSTLLQPAVFARVAYCPAEKITNLTCGAPCQALGQGVEVIGQGGDNGLVPYYFVSYDPSNNAVVVAHQGTDPGNILSVVNDVKVDLVDINAARYANTEGKGIQVHEGFQETFERTADGLLASVMEGIATKGANKVLVTGHSLGGAIAIMDALMIKSAVDPSVEVSCVTFGTPRGGNQAYADFVDATLTSQKYVTNKNDIVPRLPPLFLDYRHSGGEIHVNEDAGTDIVACPGQENKDPQCANGDGKEGGFLGIIPDFDVGDHFGPYFNDISFGSSFCQ